MEDNRVLCVDSRVMGLVTIMESMRSAGVHLKKCHFRGTVPGAIDLFVKNTKAIKVFMISLPQLQDHAQST